MALTMGFEMINEEVEETVGLIRRGYQREVILNKIQKICFNKERLFEIAKCRIKAKKKFGELADKLFFDEEGLRYATPPVVARYRAERLKCKRIADVSCGVGVQLIFFSKYAEYAVGVERNPFRAELARLNAAAMDCNNLAVMKGDAFDKKIIEKLDVDCVFSDPSRLPQEKIRRLETLQPNPIKIYRLYHEKTSRIAFELPPQISQENIIIEGEKEYTSLDFRLNRLALYTGELATCNVSAVSLPTKETVTDQHEYVELNESDKVLDYLYEVDSTVTKANLLGNLAGKIGFEVSLVQSSKRRTLLTSNVLHKSAFLRTYLVKETCDFNVNIIHKTLREVDAKKATLRFEIKTRDYWRFRKRLEADLTGDKHVYLFKIGDKAVITEPLKHVFG
ncbi:MAG TPA: SAM-dependent methyltransferase [Thermoplasmatales archaeon]|nr:SAM-dependent methyltransferase [Thermoplasmatales archaeon]